MLASRDELWLTADAIGAHKLRASSTGGAIAFAVRMQARTEPNRRE
jgi:hypothetical protein